MKELGFVIDHWDAILGIVGVLYGLWKRRSQLPKTYADIVKRLRTADISIADIMNWIGEVAEYEAKTPAQKREWVVERIKTCANAAGVAIPTSSVNLLVELLYDRWQNRG